MQWTHVETARHALVLKPSSEPDAVNRLQMEDVVFEGNVATDFGGALEVSAPADVTVSW